MSIKRSSGTVPYFGSAVNESWQGMAGAWIPWTTSWTAGATSCNPGTGVGDIQCKYQHIGRTVFYRIDITIGTSPTLGTSTWVFTLPKTRVGQAGGWVYAHSGTADYHGVTRDSTGVTDGIVLTDRQDTSYNYINPFTFNADDVLRITGFYETDTEGYSAATTRVFDLANSQKSSADTLDDEFESTTLDAKWTAVSGSSATVDISASANVEQYDLTSRPGHLLVKAGPTVSSSVELRQDVTIADGDSVVACMDFGWTHGDGSTISNNEQRFGICLNDSNTSYTSGTYLWLAFDTQAAGNTVFAYDGSVIGRSGVGTNLEINGGTSAFFRIDRDNLTARIYWSIDGASWQPLDVKVFTTWPDNLWIFAECGASFQGPAPIHTCRWIRQGEGGSVDPWDPFASVAVDLAQYGARAYVTTAKELATATDWTVEFDATSFDEGGVWSSSSDTRLTAPKDGIYTICGAVNYDETATGTMKLRFRLNGTTDIFTVETDTSASYYNGHGGTCTWKLSAHDYVEMIVRHHKGSNATVTNNEAATWFSIAKL